MIIVEPGQLQCWAKGRRKIDIHPPESVDPADAHLTHGGHSLGGRQQRRCSFSNKYVIITKKNDTILQCSAGST